MKSVFSKVSYMVNSENICNLGTSMKPSKERCRFAVEQKRNVFICVLWNQPLLTDGTLIHKCQKCIRETAGVKE